jgi:mycofactocin precursor
MSVVAWTSVRQALPNRCQFGTLLSPMRDPASQPATEAPTPAPDPAVAPETNPRNDELVETDLLVEDVSIDGMCGVY